MAVSTHGADSDAVDTKPPALEAAEDPDTTTVEHLVAESFDEHEYRVYKGRWLGLVSLCLLNISAGEPFCFACVSLEIGCS